MADAPVFARVNCPERMVIILDPSKEMGETYFNADETNLRPNFSWIKASLEKFLRTKSILNRKHQFALTLLQNDGLFWYQEFTSDVQLILECLNDTEPADEEVEEIKEISLDPIFKDLAKQFASSASVDNSLIPRFVVRVILIYGRSHCRLVISDQGHQALKTLEASQRFIFDVLYLRNPADVNQEEDVLSCLSKLENRESGYILETSKNLAELFENMAKLLAHPLQRCHQSSASYTLKFQETPTN